MKAQYQYPFRIGCIQITLNRESKKTNIMYKVKVTICNSSHNCELATVFYKIAVATSAGKPKLKLSGINELLQILKLASSTSSIILRSLLK